MNISMYRSCSHTYEVDLSPTTHLSPPFREVHQLGHFVIPHDSREGAARAHDGVVDRPGQGNLHGNLEGLGPDGGRERREMKGS